MGTIAQYLGKTPRGLAHPLVALAPMSGVSDLGMRLAVQSFGASYVVTEMVDAAFYSRRDAANQLKAEGRGIAHHVVQIAGCRADVLADAARLAEAEGAATIDINMGCPAKKVVGGLAGSALMRDLDHATDLIRATVAAVSIPVTVKMRLGWDDASRNAPDLARRAEQEGVAMVVVHGRTRCQFYKGRADWGAIAAIKQSVRIPVVANGDCESLGDARAMLEQSGADGVMIGRAATGRPWMIGEIAAALAGLDAPPSDPASRREAALRHYDILLSTLGVEQGVRHARKHLAAYAEHAGVPPGSTRHVALVTSTDPDRVAAMLASLFDDPALEVAA